MALEGEALRQRLLGAGSRPGLLICLAAACSRSGEDGQSSRMETEEVDAAAAAEQHVEKLSSSPVVQELCRECCNTLVASCASSSGVLDKVAFVMLATNLAEVVCRVGKLQEFDGEQLQVASVDNLKLENAWVQETGGNTETMPESQLASSILKIASLMAATATPEAVEAVLKLLVSELQGSAANRSQHLSAQVGSHSAKSTTSTILSREATSFFVSEYASDHGSDEEDAMDVDAPPSASPTTANNAPPSQQQQQEEQGQQQNPEGNAHDGSHGDDGSGDMDEGDVHACASHDASPSGPVVGRKRPSAKQLSPLSLAALGGEGSSSGSGGDSRGAKLGKKADSCTSLASGRMQPHSRNEQFDEGELDALLDSPRSGEERPDEAARRSMERMLADEKAKGGLAGLPTELQRWKDFKAKNAGAAATAAAPPPRTKPAMPPPRRPEAKPQPDSSTPRSKASVQPLPHAPHLTSLASVKHGETVAAAAHGKRPAVANMPLAMRMSMSEPGHSPMPAGGLPKLGVKDKPAGGLLAQLTRAGTLQRQPSKRSSGVGGAVLQKQSSGKAVLKLPSLKRSVGASQSFKAKLPGKHAHRGDPAGF